MKQIAIILILGIFLVGCSTTKEMKKENMDLISKTTSMQSKIDKLSADNLNLTSSFESKIKKCDASLKDCNSELEQIKTFYSAYKDRLSKMKSELTTAFPNNLNEANFSIREDDGRLIITIPSKILYARGSDDFGPDALLVIQKLTTVFRNNPNLQILIEGHTDDTPIRAGSRYKDNWDLSVARSVKIVRQFEIYGVDSQRLTAAGRGYYAPISRLATEEARAKNRRTEIIIRPKIADLLRMMDDLD